MWNQFTNIDVECWRHAGKLGLSEPSLCLFHATVDRGREILQALDELQAEGCDSQRALTFRPSQRDRSIGTLRLRLVAPTNELRVMNISCEPGTAVIEMTPIGLPLVRHAVSVWCDGGEDFRVSPEHANLKKRELGIQVTTSGELWFWGPGYAGP